MEWELLPHVDGYVWVLFGTCGFVRTERGRNGFVEKEVEYVGLIDDVRGGMGVKKNRKRQ